MRLFARTLRASVRAEDLVCRFGGEEFVLVFPGVTAAEAPEPGGDRQLSLYE